MPEINDVQIGETIAVEWGNAIRDRTIQRYADAAERDELHPNPTEGDLSYLEDTNSIEVYDGFTWVAGIPNQAVTTPKIADGAVTTAKVADGAVTAPKIGSGSITTDKILNEAVTSAKIADGAVTIYKIADGAVTAAKIGDGSITTGKMVNEAVTAPKIANGAVTQAKVADGAVITAKIADEAVTSVKLAAQAVTTGRIASGAVTQSRIAGGAIAGFERSGATVATSVSVPSSVGNLATVTLNIPSGWSSWDCVVFAQATADTVGTVDNTILLSVRIDGTDGPTFRYRVPGAGATSAAAASFRSGITTTGTRTIALRGNRVSSGGVSLPTVFLYARAFRTS